jgi:hypothetical protein
MSRIATVGLCATVVLAVSTTVASSASAFTKPYFELHSTTKTFTMSGGASVWQEPPGLPLMKCNANTATGEIESIGSQKVKHVIWKFTGCTQGTKKCKSFNTSSAGEVISNETFGELGYISKSPLSVGLDFKPMAPAKNLAVFDCEEGGYIVTGSVIAKFEPVNAWCGETAPATCKLAFAETLGVQEPEHFESAPTDVLEVEYNESGVIKKLGVGLNETLTPSSKEEIKVVA